MAKNYSDEQSSQEIIRMAELSGGDKKSALLKELCRFKTKAADEFWGRHLKDTRYLPYIMMSRSDAMSDHTARVLNDLIDGIENDDEKRVSAVNRAYFLLNTCLFKESQEIINTYSKAAKQYDKIKKLDISWERNDDISPESQPEFLLHRLMIEADIGCENNFFNYLTDIIILSAANSMIYNSKSNEFISSIYELYKQYPEIYTSVGFFVKFMEDSSAAYDEFERFTYDPIDFPRIMWILDGLEWDKDSYYQGSPTAFTGPDNERLHYSAAIPVPDIRWFRFLTDNVISIVENSIIRDPFYAKSFCRRFSDLNVGLICGGDNEIMGLMKNYFTRSAVLAGNPSDFMGLKKCGLINTPEELYELTMNICRNIADGKQSYCFDIMLKIFHFYSDDVMPILEEAADFLKENDKSERLALQRQEFFTQLELFKAGKPNTLFAR